MPVDQDAQHRQLLVADDSTTIAAKQGPGSNPTTSGPAL